MSVFQPGNTAVITGGASGIGLALAKRCVSAGMKVLVADISEGNLERAQSELTDGKGKDGKVEVFRMDVGKTEDWERLRRRVEEVWGGRISLLALNAGIGPPSSWTSSSSFTTILSTNLFGVIYGITTLLPAVQSTATKTSPAAIVITGSKQGITNPPGNPAYNASKSAVKTLAEHLDYDLRSNPQISVHLLVPGWTFTGLTGSSRPGYEKPEGAWFPEQVVEYLEARMREGKFYVLCPDNDVTEATDKKRMLWSVGDLVEGRPPLTRWRDDWKDKAKEWMDKQ